MAVEARRMNHLPSPFITNNGDFMKQSQEVLDICNYKTMPVETAGLWPYVAGKSVPEIVNNFPADSGLTSNNFPAAPARKRQRRSGYEEPPCPFPCRLSDEEIINSHVQQQQSEIDRFIAIHREKVRMAMEIRKKRESGMLVRAIEERLVKKLKEKDEEIERMGKLNWVLQERVKRLCMENQLWRDLAETNEATVNSLRTNLERLISAANDTATAANDAESSCGSNSGCGITEEESGGGRRCRKCMAGESRVLVLPCRHLCLCTMCGSTLHTCPVCDSAINASVHVNFS
ncbi:BOI-related E3 ubiquitin-protein ligase 1-like [Cucurbita pepo subsp. pepo]|uniref:BOI-related E3 ubiquitin-protein ligase 1-like n=1 Tax=Cucurbita pepo subsp. pepo TaxID=3664 RepID=UPI000C9DA34B|nr:BOI-related E3 ubiquitin-protein ligase 1-like [Cucurbita pepo subsp. pepo]